MKYLLTLLLMTTAVLGQKLWAGNETRYIPAARATWCSEIPAGGMRVTDENLKMTADMIRNMGCYPGSMRLTDEYHLVWAVQVMQTEGE